MSGLELSDSFSTGNSASRLGDGGVRPPSGMFASSDGFLYLYFRVWKLELSELDLSGSGSSTFWLEDGDVRPPSGGGRNN